MRPHLESLKAEIKVLRGEATANKFLEEDLQLLWDKRCRDQEDLKVVSRDGLRHMGLEEILIDHLKPETEGLAGAGTSAILQETDEQSAQLCQQLLEVDVAPLPGNADQLQTLLESGMVPVTKVTFWHLSGPYSTMLTEGRGLLPQHFGSYIAAGFVNAQGQAEEVTGHIVMTVIVDTWRLLWRFGPMDRRLTFDFGKNQGLGSVDRSAHDPSTGRVRPDLTIVASKLLLFVGEEKTAEAGLNAALADIRAKFGDGLSPIFYQEITFIPYIIAAGNRLRFGMLHSSGELELCSHTIDVALERDRIVIMQIAINLYRLLLVLDSRAPDLDRRAVQGVAEHRPENTIIIRHRSSVEKIIKPFDDFLDRFGHSFEDIEEAYRLSTGQTYMVHANPPWQSRPSAPGVKRQKGVSRYKVVITRVGADSPALNTLTETKMKQVILAGLRCTQLLAAENLVHRDLRLANFFWDNGSPFVGDLELAAKAPLPVRSSELPVLKDWTSSTLDADGNYTTGSDVHQLGILLEKWLMFPIAASADIAGQASHLVNVLKGKVDADVALRHPWLNSVP